MLKASPTMTAANTLYNSAADFGNGAGLEPAPAIIIATHGTDSAISRSLHTALMGYRVSTQVCLSGSPAEILAQVRALSHAGRRFAYAVLTFEMHHLSPQESLELLDQFRGMMPNGTLLLADYAFSGAPREAMEQAVDSDAETAQINRYGGLDNWLTAHCRYNATLMRQIVSATGFTIRVDRALPAARHMIIASDRSMKS